MARTRPPGDRDDKDAFRVDPKGGTEMTNAPALIEGVDLGVVEVGPISHHESFAQASGGSTSACASAPEDIRRARGAIFVKLA